MEWMRLLASIVLAAAAVTVGTASAAQAPVARAPGLVVALEGRIYVAGKEIARGDQPAWSPSGRQVAFVRGGSVYVVRADGTNERRLTRGRSAAHSSATFPAWSPIGTRIAFAGVRDLFTVTVATGKLARLTRTAQPRLGNFTPAYSPDGGTIALTRSTDAFNNDIFLMRADGTKLRRLTKSQGTDGRFGEELMPTWSPDGHRIVFVSNRDDNWELYSIRSNGSGERRLTRTPRATEENPRFSRNGKRLLYVHDGRVAVAASDGSLLRELGRGSAADLR